MIATLIGSFSPAILSIFHLVMGYTAGILTQEKLYPWLIVPAALEIALLIFSNVLRWKNTPVLGAFLRMMRDPVARAMPNDDIRCALFRPSLFRNHLVEVVMCTGKGLENRSNRTHMSIHQGVAGAAYRSKETIYIPIIKNWKEQLMKSFGFTEKDLGRFQSDRKSYLCIPALKRGDQKVLAVVSFDSNSDGTFTPDMIKEIERITSYISDVIQGGLS